MHPSVLIINGSHREEGVTDAVVGAMKEVLAAEGIDATEIVLRRSEIAFCGNCRHCTQEPGELPGKCEINDVMTCQILQQLEAADGYIFLSPTTFGTVTSYFKRFLERLTVYGYWPWETPAPEFRKPERKAALCFSCCAAPSLLGRVMFSSISLLKKAARCVGAKTVDTLLIGLVAGEAHPTLSERDWRRIEKSTRKLVVALKHP